MRRTQHPNHGFTLIELIVIIAVLGIISIFAASRFSSRTIYDELGFFQESLLAVRYAQKLAITSGCDINVTFSSSSYQLRRWQDTVNDTCNEGDPAHVNVLKPGGSDFTGSVPSGVTITGTPDFYFDPIGIPRAIGGALINTETVVTISGRSLSIAPHTGFARCTSGC